ncbi:unnamed protein product [Penicillium salamii]|uniref:Exonuclease domain-containing protein n=1 Tax=Penicillium salamii TaxID=1612424 RepID=A0A9W4P0B1_9EURO|nr:unnamed protein product [Penicillium salamii]
MRFPTILPFDPTIPTFDPMQMGREVVLQKLFEFTCLPSEIIEKHHSMPQYQPSPIVFNNTPGIRAVLVVDCEVVKTTNNRRMLASVSVIDFFKKETLVNSLVEPAGKVVDWFPKWSGVTQEEMESARLSGTIMQNWQDAREEIWKFMDQNTILIGHSLAQSLDVLGIMHGNIVDTAIVASEAVLHPESETEKLRRTWSLKALSKQFLNIEIQSKASGHSSLLDALAIRDVMIWCIADGKGLRAWAEKASLENQQGMARRIEKSNIRKKKFKALRAERKKRAQIDTKPDPKQDPKEGPKEDHKET